MLPDLEALLAGHELYARQNHLAPDRDEARLDDALREAGTLAGSQEPDEPAALFFASPVDLVPSAKRTGA